MKAATSMTDTPQCLFVAVEEGRFHLKASFINTAF